MDDESRGPPRKYKWLIGLSLASFFAWLLLPSEGGKTLAGLFTFCLVVFAWLHLVASLIAWRPHKGMVFLVAIVSLGSCAGESALSRRDLDSIVDDMAKFNCLQARQIVATGSGFGRDWNRTDQENQWLALPPSPGKFHNLFLTYRPEADDFSLDVPMPDMPTVVVACKPDPRTPGDVRLIN